MRKVHYKVSYEELSNLLLVKNCQICDVKLTDDRLKPTSKCIDHSHDTDEVRGVLCHSCNLGIGHLKDDHKVLLQAQQYLRKENKNDKRNYKWNSSISSWIVKLKDWILFGTGVAIKSYLRAKGII